MSRLKSLALNLLISLGVGTLASALTGVGAQNVEQIKQPPWAPPSWLFPVVWTVLYALMGVSAWLIQQSESEGKAAALKTYGAQLVINFVWPFLFFSAQQYFGAFVWLLLLIVFVVVMIYRFWNINPLAAYLQIPYLIWLLFAGALNLAISFLNP